MSRSRPTVDYLYESGKFRLVESFSIDDMAEFLAREAGVKPAPLRGATPTKGNKVIPIAFMVLFGGAFGWLLGHGFSSPEEDALLGAGWQLLLALVLFFVLWLPLHEGIHALFFKLLGAPKVGFGYSARGMMVYAYSQRFVMSLQENALVAAMPFVIITPLLVALLIWVPGLSLMWGLTLLIHTVGCMGDFILIKHAFQHRNDAMYTYDDLEEKRTYFFQKQ